MITTPKWWQTGIIYQIYPRSFMDANGDGIGDLAGVLQRLDYLRWLGVDAIWFSPIFPSPMKDFGYDVADYVNIHPDFGTMADFDRLLEEAQSYGIKIILDLVPNHTSDQHAWFAEARSSTDNPKRDWYIWRDPNPDGSPPNNWQSAFGGSAWELDAASGQYYLHSFLKEQPDLNWRNPAVKAAIFDVIRFWLGKGVAGFRVDVIDLLYKDAAFRDNPIVDGVMQSRYSSYQPEVHDVIGEMRAVFDEFPNSVFIGETNYDADLATLAKHYGDNDQLMLPFNFQPISMTRGQVPSAEAFQAHINAYDSALGRDQQPNWVLGNHDMPRLASRVGPLARAFALLQMTLRGTPFIYYGEELGMEDVNIPAAQQQDPFGIRVPGQSRDPARTPMQWDSSANAGFSASGVKAWLPLAPDHAKRNVALGESDVHSMLTFYQRLFTLRRSLSALNQGLYYPIPNPPTGIIAYVRQYNDQRLVVAVNFTDEERDINVTGFQSGHVILSTRLDRDELADLNHLQLHPYEGVLIEIPAGTQAVARVEIQEL